MEFILNGKRYELTKREVEMRLRGVRPEQIYEHAVEANGQLYPVKQVFAVATGRDVSEFTSQRAQDVLRRLGFTDPRKNGSGAATPPPPALSPALAGAGNGEEWVLELRTLGGGHQEIVLVDPADVEGLKDALPSLVGTDTSSAVRGVHPDAVGREVVFLVAWRNVAAATVLRRVER
jgi:hypothetical protein